MKVKSRLSKIIAILGLATATIGAVNVATNSTVQASTFHWLRKDHRSVTLGIGDSLPVRMYDHGKLVQKDDPNDDSTYCDTYYPLKTRGWKYINGVKYYNIYNEHSFDTTSAYIKAKYFSKEYCDLSFESVYVVNHKFHVLSDDMQKTDQGFWYGKGDVITIINDTKNDNLVYSISPMLDGKHDAIGISDYTSMNIGNYIHHSDFVKYCHKAGKNTKFLMNDGDDYYTNASLKRGGIYHNGKFYKYYTRYRF